MRRAWWQFWRREDEFAEEMASHLAMAIQERVARGESVESATAAARREFGNREVVRATTREMWGWMWLEQFVLDFQYALRSLRVAPGFLAKAVLSLGFGLGLATAMFVFVDTILYPTVPYGHTERLQFVELKAVGAGPNRLPSIGEQLRALRGVRGVARAGAAVFISGYVDVNGVGSQRMIKGVSADYFDVLDFRPRLGRFPTPEEVRTTKTVVVTDRLWRSRFENRKDIGEAHLTYEHRDFTIVGVLPIGADHDTQGDIWIPYASDAVLDTIRAGTIGVRLGPDVGAASIAPQLAIIAARFNQTTGVRSANYVMRSGQPRDHRMTDAELFLFAAAFAVLAIACTNVAALMLARGSARRRDFALRRAIGATSLRIARDVLAEVVVISSLGALVGAAVAKTGLVLLGAIIPEPMISTGVRPPSWNTNVFVLVAGGFVAAVALAGALPAWRASRTMPSELLKANAGTTTGRVKRDFRFFLIAELALSMVLVLTAAMMVHATIKYTQFSYGFEPRPLLRVQIGLSNLTDTLNADARGQLQRDVLARIRSEPGVVAAATFSQRQVDNGRLSSDELLQSGSAVSQQRYFEVSPGFFAATGIPIVAGRDVTEGDRATGGALILTRRLATSLFPRGNAIGGRVKFGPPQSRNGWISVVGITADVAMERPFNPTVPIDPPLFGLTTNPPPTSWSLVVRPTAGNDRIDIATSRVLRDALPPRVRWSISPWLEGADSAQSMFWFVSQVFGIFGVCALFLAAAGLYSVVSHSVAQRSREFGVRIALGATRRQILQVVMLYGAELMLAGALLGALMSFWSVSVFRNIMFGLGPADPLSIVVAGGTMVLATVLACLAPAIRATRADPLEILRAT